MAGPTQPDRRPLEQILELPLLYIHNMHIRFYVIGVYMHDICPMGTFLQLQAKLEIYMFYLYFHKCIFFGKNLLSQMEL